MAKTISRRKFIGDASCAALGSATLFSSLMGLSTISAMAQPEAGASGDYKAMVCILLAGGCDSFNILVPRGPLDYANYAATRGNMAIPSGELLNIHAQNTQGRLFGLHPAMQHVKNIFEKGNAAFISGVGTLVHPIADVTDYKNNKYKAPVGLYSHSDQIKHWQTSVPQDRKIASGWAGRMADILHTINDNHQVSMNISLSGRNTFQSGNSVIEYAINRNGVQGVDGIDGGRGGWLSQIRNEALDDLLSQNYMHIFEDAYAGMNRSTIEANKAFSEATDKVEPFVTEFSETKLSENLRMIAKVIAAKDDMGMKRQTFFSTFGGWDHHSNLLGKQEEMLPVLDKAVGEFFSALKEIGMEDKVTLFTISDFGRTLTSNDTGTDHGWGGHSLVVGGGVKGRNIYGVYPEMYFKDNPLLTQGRGNMVPQVSTDEYFAELALWFGVAPGSLTDVLPNLGNFYSHSPNNKPLGFL